ncbi:MAG TPA: hypothetical protein DCS93_42955 [Microscillaceae bacterium]|nr:hypothetical protein [Microscillaceae bacterium]
MNTSSDYQHFETYQSFFTLEEAQPLLEFLKEFEVPYHVEETRELLGDAIIGQHLEARWKVRLSPEDFENVNELLRKAAEQIDTVPKNHYFQRFTNPELRQVIAAPDEWNPQDVHFAKLLLKERGKGIEE